MTNKLLVSQIVKISTSIRSEHFCLTLSISPLYRNLPVLQKWIDYKLRWDPGEYGGVDMLYVPSQHIWLPDIVLFNK